MIKGLDKKRLRNLLALFFIALAVPTVVLIWQAYSQLKWEAFHQHRGVAEELTQRIDSQLNDMIRVADSRSFADYSFLVVSGDPNAKFVQRSPLSAYPVAASLPSVLGHFQVDSQGAFSTPLLPAVGTKVGDLGISDSEFAERQKLARDIQEVLADNRLVQAQAIAGAPRALGRSAAAPAPILEEEKKDKTDAFRDYDQTVFDELSKRQNESGKVSAFALNEPFDMKSEDAEQEVLEQGLAGEIESSPGRRKRREQIALPESVQPAEEEVIANLAAPSSLRISTFESEIDPLEFSLLDSGHFVLYRKVWRDGERYIQGFVVDQATFLQDTIGSQFAGTALSAMANLNVAYEGVMISGFSGSSADRTSSSATGFDGELLYRSRLTAPLNSLELIFSIRHLPAGAGAGVLGWVTLRGRWCPRLGHAGSAAGISRWFHGCVSSGPEPDKSRPPTTGFRCVSQS